MSDANFYKKFTAFLAEGKEPAKAEKKYGVYLQGGSIGEKNDKPKKTFDDMDSAKAEAKKRNSSLTPGEKGHYKMKYVAKVVTEGSLSENRWAANNPDKDWDEENEKAQDAADDRRKADKEDAACNAVDKAKKAKKPANVKESGADFFRRYADLITEAESAADREDDDDDTNADEEDDDLETKDEDKKKKNLPPWLKDKKKAKDDK